MKKIWWKTSGKPNPITGNTLTGVISGSTISFKATQGVANTVLPQVLFTPNANANGTGFGVSIKVDDQGNTGSVGAVFGPISKTFSFVVSAVNDAPVNNAQISASSLEDTSLVFNLSNNNQLSISDPDGNVSVEIRLQSDHGVLSLSGINGLSFINGTGVADRDLSFTGTVNDINAALNGLIYRPDQNFAGSDSLRLTTNDQGNKGSGGAKTSDSSIALQVLAVNDLPKVQIAENFDLLAGSTKTINGLGLMSIDIESDATSLSYTLDSLPTQGELLLNGSALSQGSTFTQNDVNRGALAYRAFAQSHGDDQIALSVRDADAGSAPPISIKVSLKANPGYAASAGNTTGTLGGSNGSSTLSTSATTTAAVIGTSKSAQDSSTSGATGLQTAAPGGLASGGSPATASAAGSKASGIGADNAPAKSAERDGLFASLSAVSTNSTSTRSESARLLETTLSPMPLVSVAPTPQAGNTNLNVEGPSKAVDTERIFFAPGITLPAQSPQVERIVSDNGFQKNIEKVREDVMSVAAIDRGVVASTIGVSASFTIGYILWLVRGGVLISSLLASLPAWRMVDPLPILGSLGKGKDDDESLEEMLDGRHQVITDEPEETFEAEENESRTHQGRIHAPHRV